MRIGEDAREDRARPVGPGRRQRHRDHAGPEAAEEGDHELKAGREDQQHGRSRRGARAQAGGDLACASGQFRVSEVTRFGLAVGEKRIAASVGPFAGDGIELLDQSMSGNTGSG